MYSQTLGELLDSWDSLNSLHRFFLSYQIEDSSTTLKAIQEHRHQASVYPASHTDIYLADIVFFIIGDTVPERRPQAFNGLYLGALDHNYVMNDISILVFKTWELKPGSQGKPYVDLSEQGTAQLLVGSNPGPPEIDDPK
ncbi:hypothetical protein DSO57_1022706 [Entomophthora muscae]|uniref:Uncharacterized protein n=1 Tax=Entomophthora muscae TaxID=34485 RepID=A0ACC2UPQ3_9FUNG|nr:hypothetical protein DSO57_1022706 [Entomophthora muscae]